MLLARSNRVARDSRIRSGRRSFEPRGSVALAAGYGPIGSYADRGSAFDASGPEQRRCLRPPHPRRREVSSERHGDIGLALARAGLWSHPRRLVSERWVALGVRVSTSVGGGERGSLWLVRGAVTAVLCGGSYNRWEQCARSGWELALINGGQARVSVDLCAEVSL